MAARRSAIEGRLRIASFARARLLASAFASRPTPGWPTCTPVSAANADKTGTPRVHRHSRVTPVRPVSTGGIPGSAPMTTGRRKPSSASCSRAAATGSCSPPSSPTRPTRMIRTAPTTTARRSSPRSRRACAGCRPTTSTCTGSTTVTSSLQSRSSCVPWMTRSASARSSTPQSRTGQHGRSPKPAPPPGCAPGHRSPRSSCGTTCSTVPPSGNCCPWPPRLTCRRLPGARWPRDGSPASTSAATPPAG